jgi:AcrR family transcriptional regulator
MGRRSLEIIRREDLITAAMDVVAIEGHDAATMQRIGKAAEISPGIVHHYFGDKHQLMLATMRAVRRPVATTYRARLAAPETDAALDLRESHTELAAILNAHLDPAILTIKRAAAWVQFTSRVAYIPEYAGIHRAVRYCQVAALRRALFPIARNRQTVPALAVRVATALDGCWWECATRPGGMTPGEARAFIDALLEDSIW